ncbi:MAG: metallophosphoesterase [Oscillospiraceae bacterium]|nr:metallophosphoesterase [Oscillospiraceae bacterium]
MHLFNRAKMSSTPKRAFSFVLMLSMILSMMIPAFSVSAAATDVQSDVVLMSLTRTAATAAETGNQFTADSGVFANVSNLTAWSNNTQKAVGGTGRTPIVFNNAQTTGGWKPVSVAGLDNADAFQIKLSTVGYENIRFTCTQKSTGSGPDAFLLAYSVGNPEGPYTVISGSETGTNGIPAISRMSNDTYAALQPSYANFVLPAEMENEAEVYLRVVFNGLTNLGANGNTSINDIVIIGDETEGGGTDDAPAKLVVGFVYIGIDNASSGTHSFVEIYNPNSFTVTLTDTYSLHYKSMAPSGANYVTPNWIKWNLVGEIPAYHSFLVNLGPTGVTSPNGTNGRLDLRDKQFDQTVEWPVGIKGFNKGFKVVITSNQDQLPSALKNPFTGDGEGQIDGYVDMYGVSGNDNTAPSVDGYETDRILANAGEAQSKQKGFVRINKDSNVKYEDTDNNLLDFQQVDFRSSDITDWRIIPRSLADGANPEAVSVPTVDKTALVALIATASEKIQSNYTPDSWAAFINAFDAATTVAANSSATQAAVDSVKLMLQTAMNALVVFVPVDPGQTDDVLMALTRTAANATADPGNQFNADSGIFADVSNLTAWNNNEQKVIGYQGTNRTPVVFNNAAAVAWRSVGSASVDAGVTVDTASAFQIKFETTGYENIRFSCTQKSTGSGPESFALAYSIGSPTGPYTIISDSKHKNVTASNDTYAALAPSYVDFELPAEIANQSEVYLRVYMVDSALSNRSNGNTSINNIEIIGTKAETVLPKLTDVELMKLTRTAANAAADAGNQFNADSGVFASVSNLTAWNNNTQRAIGYAGSNRTPIVFNNAAAPAWRSVGPAAADAGITVDTASAFQIKFETTGYENIRFSCAQKSTGSGPESFMLAYSVGSPTGPYTTIPGSRHDNVRLSNDTYAALQPSYIDFVLPEEMANQSEVYLRVYMVDSSLSDRSNGNTSINDIVIVGDEIGGTSTPTVNKTALRALITTASEKVQSDYTADSWLVFEQAYEAAQIVAANSSATQAAVDAAKATLQTAMDALKAQSLPGGEGKSQSQWGTFVNAIPNNISNTFTADPKTTRTITWQTGTGVSGEVVMNGVTYPAVTTTIGSKNHHRVDLTGLTPGATYTYVCGTEGAYSKSYSFTTEKANSVPFSIIHVTDPQMGAGSGNAQDAATWKRVMEAAIAKQPNPAFVVNTGDVVNNSTEATIPFYFDYAQDIIASNAFVYSMGNNDTGAWYNRYFYTPDNGPRSEIYSFEYGNALFINIDSNVSGLANNAAFMTWLENTLKNSDATWKVIMMHQGFFGRSASPNAITDMLYKYGVDLALIGHNHFYYRSYMIDGRGNLVDEGGIVWSLPQSAGNKQNDTASNRKDMAMNATPGPMFSTFDFDKGTLTLNAYTVNAQGVATLYDTYTITKAVAETEGPANAPTHITSARGENDTAMGFSWYSNSAANANVTPLESVVQIAKKSDMAGNEFPVAKATTYTSVPTAAASGKYSNQVSVTGLDFSTEYVYRVGNGTSNNWSDVGSFRTGGGEGSAFSFLYASDAQTTSTAEGNTWKNTLDKALTNNPNAAFMVHAGDQVDTQTNETQFDYFFTPQSSLLNMPLMPLTGNHDRANNFGWHFNVPQNGSSIQSRSNANYWYMYGDALFLVIDQNSNITTQANWMRQVVAANPSKWIILCFHETIYGVYGRGPTNRDAINAICAELKIDLVLQGHDHSWMRTNIMKNGVATEATMVDGYCVNPDGTIILDIGGAGDKQYTAANASDSGNGRNSSWVATYRNGEPMYAVIDVTADTLTINAYTANSTVAFDTFAIKKTSVVAVNKEELAAVIEIAVAKVETDYTAASWAGFAASLTEAQQVYADADATQEQVDIATENLMNAMDKLVKVYTVTFVADNDTENTTIIVADGGAVTKPEDPKNDGYTFLGWFDGETEFDFNTVITADLVLTAKWETEEVPVLSYNAYDLGDFIRVWFSYPVAIENITAIDQDGNEVLFDGVILEGAKTYEPGIGYTGEYSYVDVFKTNDWKGITLTLEANDQIVDVELVNDRYAPPITVTLVSATATAYVTKLNGNKNDLTITVTEKYSDGSVNTVTATFSISNNAAGNYSVGAYTVYVATKGNDQVNDCRIVKMAEAA